QRRAAPARGAHRPGAGRPRVGRGAPGRCRGGRRRSGPTGPVSRRDRLPAPRVPGHSPAARRDSLRPVAASAAGGAGEILVMTANPVANDTPGVDVCLLLEGTWPYVRGGVSSWINQLILGLP